jgi:hypothetical protein
LATPHSPLPAGKQTVPVKASAKRCVLHGQDAVGATPEFRTSIACCGCHSCDVKRELSEEYAAALEKAREKSEKTGKRMRRKKFLFGTQTVQQHRM